MFCDFETIYQVGVLVGAAIGLGLALWRGLVANRNRLEDQFLRGAALMDEKNNGHTGRVAGTVTLADIALSHPGKYDKRVMRVFEGVLEFPSRYGRNHKKEHQVDYTSRDTVTMLEAISQRSSEARRRYTIRLNEDRPFRVDHKGNVVRNYDYDDPMARKEGPK